MVVIAQLDPSAGYHGWTACKAAYIDSSFLQLEGSGHSKIVCCRSKGQKLL